MKCLDTSVLIDFLKGDPTIISLVNKMAETEGVRITTITEYELLKYKGDLAKRKLAEALISVFEVCPFDRRAASEASLLFENLSRKGKLMNEVDVLIAGIAFSNGDPLVTRDKAFENIGKDVLIV